ncbi:glycosyl transferase [Yersinia kristensenii]|uniref:Putative glycosyl transferase n=1 Tax=Yersinia kristensenii TaxID=28152 RepID=Q0H785_YERKR|nr:glycosyl transferase [Yersinia kristensenii]ABB04474.1 putative glycosyl transferase [Yersinia kristensenii]
MKILIVNYHYPPSATAHSYRWALLRCFFLQQGHSVDFICGGVTCEQDNENNIYRGNFPFTVKKGHSNFVSASNKSANGLKSKLLSLVKYTYRKIFWPDGLWHWLPFSLYQVFKLRKEKYDLVIGYSPTFSALIASSTYKIYNRNAKFIVDFGDPFSVSKEMPVNNYYLYKKLNHWIEKKIFSIADLISLTNEKTYDLYRAAHPDVTKFTVIPHLVNINEFYNNPVTPLNLKLKIGYIGAFHKGIREPHLATDKICSLSNYLVTKCQFDFYGPLNGIKLIDSKRINYHGVVGRDKALELMKNLNILINVENESCPMSPSKIYECMATGKPILNFLSSNGFSSFDEYPLVLNIDKNTSPDEIEQFILDNSNKILSKEEVENILSEKTLSFIGEKYLSVIGD